MPGEIIPAIAPHPDGTPFFWSVIIPCYNPQPAYLEETLQSVLQQDPGATEMEFIVIDDASPAGPPVELVKKLAGNRITVQRVEKNLGLAGIWNHCIGQARGRWLHILHQDDVVKPGFYDKMREGIESPDAPGLLYCRQEFIDERGQHRRLSEPDAEKSGCLPDALPCLARAQVIQTPSVVVRRSVFEAVGGFRSDLCFTLDWEMWCRIARKFPVWYEPEVLASYRVHSAAETARLIVSGQDIEDLRKCINIVSGYVDDSKTRAEVRKMASRRYAMFALKNAEDLLRAGKPDAAWRQVSGALKCDFSPKVLKDALMLLPLAMGATAAKVPAAK
ncbi:MAG TPA: glycosyltransferase [Verrucomicrobiae bacterium]|nr:glycosyltransferase [Verrucomicrobiae bacterium]